VRERERKRENESSAQHQEESPQYASDIDRGKWNEYGGRENYITTGIFALK
jgi:hypothetical protein